MLPHVFLCLCVLFTGSPLVRAQALVLGASQPVVALAGDDVTLPCRCDPALDLEPLTVEWSSSKQKPHPSDPLKRRQFVHVYTDWHEDLDMKVEGFINRTALFPESLRAGNASLHIQRVQLSDNGTYRCFIPNLRTELSLKEAYVTLLVLEALTPKDNVDLDPEVKEEEQPTSTFSRSFLPTIVLVIILILFIGIFVIWTKLKRKSDKTLTETESEDRAQDQVKVPVPEVEERRQLMPCDVCGLLDFTKRMFPLERCGPWHFHGTKVKRIVLLKGLDGVMSGTSSQRVPAHFRPQTGLTHEGRTRGGRGEDEGRTRGGRGEDERHKKNGY